MRFSAGAPDGTAAKYDRLQITPGGAIWRAGAVGRFQVLLCRGGPTSRSASATAARSTHHADRATGGPRFMARTPLPARNAITHPGLPRMGEVPDEEVRMPQPLGRVSGKWESFSTRARISIYWHEIYNAVRNFSSLIRVKGKSPKSPALPFVNVTHCPDPHSQSGRVSEAEFRGLPSLPRGNRPANDGTTRVPRTSMSR